MSVREGKKFENYWLPYPLPLRLFVCMSLSNAHENISSTPFLNQEPKSTSG